jgi:aminoglycoside 6'-N-acetyltransferase I
MQRQITVRAATIEDLDTVVAMRLALIREQPTHPLYGRLRPDAERRARNLFAEQLESATERMFLAEERREPVGIIRCAISRGSPLLFPSEYGYISSAYVVPAARGRGVLTRMMAAVEEWCAAMGLDELRLHNVAGDSRAEGVWDSLGFEVVEQVRRRPLARRM